MIMNILIGILHLSCLNRPDAQNWPQKGGGREIKPESTLLIEQTDRLKSFIVSKSTFD